MPVQTACLLILLAALACESTRGSGMDEDEHDHGPCGVFGDDSSDHRNCHLIINDGPFDEDG